VATIGTTRLTVNRDVDAALRRREGLLERLHAEETDCYRLFHGAVEGRPGLALDRYGSVLLAQTWREPLAEGELHRLNDQVESALGVSLTPVWNHRERGRGRRSFKVFHDVAPLQTTCRELGLEYDARPRHHGRDPLLFLDFRAARRRVLKAARDCTVLNLFAYTCGIGVCASRGGAREVLNVDFSETALQIGEENAARNRVGDSFSTLREDVIPVLRQFSGLGLSGRAARQKFVRLEPRTWDLIVLDPPRRAKGRFGAVDVVRDYASLLKPVIHATAPDGEILATNNVASVDVDHWLKEIRRCAGKAGRHVQDIELIAPESDWPSPDGMHPLKMAWVRL